MSPACPPPGSTKAGLLHLAAPRRRTGDPGADAALCRGPHAFQPLLHPGTGPPWRGSAMGRPWESVRVTAWGAQALAAAESTTSTQGEEVGSTQTQESFPALRQGLGRTLSARPRLQSPRQRGHKHAARKDLGAPAGDAAALVTEGGPSGALSKSPFSSGQVPGPAGVKGKARAPSAEGAAVEVGPGRQGGQRGPRSKAPSRAEAPRDARAESSRVDGLRSMEAPRSTGAGLWSAQHDLGKSLARRGKCTPWGCELCKLFSREGQGPVASEDQRRCR